MTTKFSLFVTAYGRQHRFQGIGNIHDTGKISEAVQRKESNTLFKVSTSKYIYPHLIGPKLYFRVVCLLRENLCHSVFSRESTKCQNCEKGVVELIQLPCKAKDIVCLRCFNETRLLVGNSQCPVCREVIADKFDPSSNKMKEK